MPTLITEECNLSESFERQAALQVEPHTESIADGILSLVKLHEEGRKRIGKNAYNLAHEKYTWDAISEQIIEVYDWMLGSNKIPVTMVEDRYASMH